MLPGTDQGDVISVVQSFSSLGAIREAGSNRPVYLDDPAKVWIVENGTVDVSFVKKANGQLMGTRRHIFRAREGECLFGMDVGERGATLLAVGSVNARLIEISKDRFESSVRNVRLFEQLVGKWVSDLSAWIGQLPPAAAEEGSPGNDVILEDQSALRTSAPLVWLKLKEGNLRFMGRIDLPPFPSTRLFPMASGSMWIRAGGETALSILDSKDTLEEGTAWEALECYHALVLDCLIDDCAQREKAESERLERKADADSAVLKSGIIRLTSVLERKDEVTAVPRAGASPLLEACMKVGEALGMAVQGPENGQGEASLDEIARASRFRTRKAVLSGKWWKHDNGPLLGFRSETGAPVALIPLSATSYSLYDSQAGQTRRVTEAEAATLAPEVFIFYRPLPERPISGKELLSLGFRGCGHDLLLVILMGLLGALLSLLTPIITGHVFGVLIPDAARGRLIQMGFILVSCALGSAAFEVTKGFALVRVEGKADSSLQAALWDRLLSLPAPFFRGYSVGDLAVRSLGINTIREVLSSVTITAILGVIFAVFNLVLLFYYSWRLALISIGLTIVSVLVLAAASVYQTRRYAEMQEVDGKTSGLIFQFINGIAKIRVSGAENRAFASWADAFHKSRMAAMKVGWVGCILGTFNAVFPIIVSLLIFMWVAWKSEGKLSVGDFVAFQSAFGNFQGAFVQMGMALTSSLIVVPVFRRLKPILGTLPESDRQKSHPGELSGNVEVNHIHFRYRSDGPLVLKDVSLHIGPGEFVAVVGSSGSGKSTLMRLLLGFETPEAGGIYYDGQDLSTLDVREVRRQIGIILQSSKTTTDTIFKNIVGASPLSKEDAWEAARMAGFDKDIEALPMGMMTVVAPGGTNLSGGQRQRLLIARALVRKPRIILFDEATSALDNKTQAVVSQSLEELNVARIVIAHRLSTIMKADRIYVMDSGEIKEVGTYQELMDKKGLFHGLAKRQII